MVMADIYRECGRIDEAFDELETLLSLETAYTVNDLKMNPEYDPYRDNPRYKELVKRYGGEYGGI